MSFRFHILSLVKPHFVSFCVSHRSQTCPMSFRFQEGQFLVKSSRLAYLHETTQWLQKVASPRDVSPPTYDARGVNFRGDYRLNTGHHARPSGTHEAKTKTRMTPKTTKKWSKNHQKMTDFLMYRCDPRHAPAHWPALAPLFLTYPLVDNPWPKGQVIGFL